MTQTSGASRRGNAKLFPVVIARSTPVRRSPAFGRRRMRRSNPAFRFLGPKAGLLRGACHRAALRADPLARSDGLQAWLFEN
jgi:hypothetical protein